MSKYFQVFLYDIKLFSYQTNNLKVLIKNSKLEDIQPLHQNLTKNN